MTEFHFESSNDFYEPQLNLHIYYTLQQTEIDFILFLSHIGFVN